MLQIIKLSLFSLILYGGLQLPSYAPKQEVKTAQIRIVNPEEVKLVEQPAPIVVEPQPIKETVAPTPQEYAQKKVVEKWDESNWEDFNKLVHKESGWNCNAQNPKSTAYGLGQFLDSTWQGTGIAKTSDCNKQLDAMLIYIENRYGSPKEALAYHDRKNWY